jgi:hypothetical protein
MVELMSMTLEEWIQEGERRFGPDRLNWKFVCPVCGHIASAGDWKAAGAREAEVAFSCIGRHIPGSRSAFEDKGEGPCNYAGGGLFRLNPVQIDENEDRLFAFADV